jgi:hypothetical protein
MLTSYRISAVASLGVHTKARRGHDDDVATVERLAFDSRPYIASASPKIDRHRSRSRPIIRRRKVCRTHYSKASGGYRLISAAFVDTSTPRIERRHPRDTTLLTGI